MNYEEYKMVRDWYVELTEEEGTLDDLIWATCYVDAHEMRDSSTKDWARVLLEGYNPCKTEQDVAEWFVARFNNWDGQVHDAFKEIEDIMFN